MSNTLSHENFFSGKNELQMFPVDMMEENDFTNESDKEYADFGFTDDIDTIDSRIDKSLAKERKRVFKAKKKVSEKSNETSVLMPSGNEVVTPAVECTGTMNSKIIFKNEPLFFEKEARLKGRARLFSESISILNFCKKYKNYNFVLKYERKLKNAFAKNSKRKSRMRISQWRQVAAML